jgi:hypothetical protein
MAGAAETIYGIHFSYLPYLLLHAPVLGAVEGAVADLGYFGAFSRSIVSRCYR